MSGKPSVYAFEGFRLDARQRILLRTNGEQVPLGPRAFDLLVHFVERPGELLQKRVLLEALWPNVVVEENNLNQAISALRRALGEQPGDHRFIVTEPGRGYRFVATVAVVPPESTTQRRHGTGGTVAPVSRQAGALALRKHAGTAITAAALVSVLAVFAYIDHGANPLLANSVAVMPFKDLSPDSANAYICAGMHGETINQLTRLRGVNVIGRDAVLRLAEDRPSYSQIAARLKVQTILVGSCRYAGDEIRVNVELVDPTTGVNLWSADYQRDFADVFGVQSDIATNVAGRLNAALSRAERERLASRPTASMEAYKAYWHAFSLLGRGRDSSRIEALASLERAVDLDPDFALAYAHLALLYAGSAIDWGNQPAVPIEPEELERRVLTNARRALELDPSLAVAQAALGELHVRYWRWSKAEAAFAAAYDLNSNDLSVLDHYSQFKTFKGDYAAALPIAERLLELDPPLPDAEAVGTGSLYFVWLVHVYSGDTGRALVALNEHLRLHPQQHMARFNLGFVEARRGNRGAAKQAFDAVRQATASVRSPTLTANLAYGYSRIAETQSAAELFEEVLRMSDRQSIDAGTWAMAHLAVGDRGQAAVWLDKALESIELRQPTPGWFSLMIIKHDLTDDPVLKTPAFAARRERIRGT